MSVGDICHFGHLNLVCTINNLRESGVIIFKTYDAFTQALDFFSTTIEVSLQRLLVNNTCLLSQLLVLLLQDLAFLLHL